MWAAQVIIERKETLLDEGEKDKDEPNQTSRTPPKTKPPNRPTPKPDPKTAKKKTQTRKTNQTHKARTVSPSYVSVSSVVG